MVLDPEVFSLMMLPDGTSAQCFIHKAGAETLTHSLGTCMEMDDKHTRTISMYTCNLSKIHLKVRSDTRYACIFRYFMWRRAEKQEEIVPVTAAWSL